MTPSPIRSVLSVLRKHRVRALLMGGQACILYGAAEFSRDVDVVVLADDKNLDRLRSALDELDLPDLVRAKKTQRDKDWPMIRRLVEADYHNRPRRPSRAQIRFWLVEVFRAAGPGWRGPGRVGRVGAGSWPERRGRPAGGRSVRRS